MTLFHSTVSTPLGPFSFAVLEDGAAVGSAFGSVDVLASRLRMAPSRLQPARSVTSNVRAQIDAYFAGELHRFAVRTAAAGTAFQHDVWCALARIPFGETRSYGEIGRDLHSSPRAIGAANAANPLCLLVPCHRVIGSDGTLTGFAFGTERKQWLLAHESAALRADSGASGTPEERWFGRAAHALQARAVQ